MKQYTVTATKVTQSANEMLGTQEKTLWYLIIEGLESKVIINVGEKTYKSVTELKPIAEVVKNVSVTSLDTNTQQEIKQEIEAAQISRKK